MGAVCFAYERGALLQGWNRYSYVGNSPLTFIDPNGFDFFGDFFGAIGNFFSDVFNAVSSAVNSVVNFIASNPIAKRWCRSQPPL
jgi:hypothetical protein